jgi:hypothetical protein
VSSSADCRAPVTAARHSEAADFRTKEARQVRPEQLGLVQEMPDWRHRTRIGTPAARV